MEIDTALFLGFAVHMEMWLECLLSMETWLYSHSPQMEKVETARYRSAKHMFDIQYVALAYQFNDDLITTTIISKLQSNGDWIRDEKKIFFSFVLKCHQVLTNEVSLPISANTYNPNCKCSVFNV